MTTSKRVAERKIARFERSISKRGSKKGFGYSVTQILLAVFIFIVVALCLFQIIRTARGRGMA